MKTYSVGLYNRNIESTMKVRARNIKELEEKLYQENDYVGYEILHIEKEEELCKMEN